MMMMHLVWYVNLGLIYVSLAFSITLEDPYLWSGLVISLGVSPPIVTFLTLSFFALFLKFIYSFPQGKLSPHYF